MLVFGHTGITLGIAVLLSGALSRSHSVHDRMDQETQHDGQSSEVSSGEPGEATTRLSWLANLADKIDIRILLIGALLPDIIDKPVGMFFFRETLSNGRIYSHTLLFLVLITIAGLYLYRRQRKTYLLTLSFGTFTHLLLDEMWRAPRTLLWPFYGAAFDKVDITEWIPQIFDAILTDPVTYLPELVGVVILVWFAVILLYQRKVFSFLKSGQLH